MFPVTLIKTPKIPFRNEMSPDAEPVAINAVENPFTFHKLCLVAILLVATVGKKKISSPESVMNAFSHEGAGLRGNQVLYVPI